MICAFHRYFLSDQIKKNDLYTDHPIWSNNHNVYRCDWKYIIKRPRWAGHVAHTGQRISAVVWLGNLRGKGDL
jgi:hypothetical protein